jgi:hypothetical protein
MRSRRDKGRIDGAFVPMLKDTMGAAAWRAMSPYARVLYMALKSRYSFKDRNNGRIYLSVRRAAEETGLDKKTIARAFREIQFYGLILFKDLSKWARAEILRMAENPDEWLVSGHPVYLVR